jgi:hypothetical protein
MRWIAHSRQASTLFFSSPSHNRYSTGAPSRAIILLHVGNTHQRSVGTPLIKLDTGMPGRRSRGECTVVSQAHRNI